MMTVSTTFEWGDFSNVALNFFYNSTSFLNIAVGSVRSGKTITALARFLDFISNSPHHNFAIAGKSINSLRRNVVTPFLQMLNTEGISYTYNQSNQEIRLKNKVIALFGIDKEGADEKIRGYTCGGALIDEATVLPKSGFQMLLSRCSLDGSKVFVTCNPGSPQNYIYTDYVNNDDLRNEGFVKVFNFLLEDNINLSRQTIENIKAMYSKGSVFYKRNILNQWVSGQGAIFDSFTDDNLFGGKINLDDYYRVGIGSDYGVSTTTCYTVVGIQERCGLRCYDVLFEKYFNAEREGFTQSDSQRVDDIYELQEAHHFNRYNTFHVSHDAESLKAALEQDKRIIMDIQSFKPDTLDCIQKMSSLFHENRLRIHESCKETIKQVQGYEWDLKASQKGKDKPVKKDDHLVDSMRAPIMTDITGRAIRSAVVRL